MTPEQSNQAIDLLRRVLAQQKFDGGGHLTQRNAPCHSAVLEIKMLLAELDGEKPE